jgi:hypothetical protein
MCDGEAAKTGPDEAALSAGMGGRMIGSAVGAEQTV